MVLNFGRYRQARSDDQTAKVVCRRTNVPALGLKLRSAVTMVFRMPRRHERRERFPNDRLAKRLGIRERFSLTQAESISNHAPAVTPDASQALERAARGRVEAIGREHSDACDHVALAGCLAPDVRMPVVCHRTTVGSFL
jgi:hypothetical protein